MGIGADEAGRGSLVGPMVVASFKGTPPPGVKDSKMLSPQRRWRLFSAILKSADEVRIAIIPPAVIDKQNLNDIEARWLGRLAHGGIVDAPEPPERFKLRMKKYGYAAQPFFKADQNYSEVSAASIVAKVVRDALMDAIRKDTGVEGSGYPSDERTRLTFHRAGRHVRRKWKTTAVGLGEWL